MQDAVNTYKTFFEWEDNNGTDGPDSSFDLVGMRPANDENLLHACKRQTLKRPVKKRSIAHGQQALIRKNIQHIHLFSGK